MKTDLTAPTTVALLTLGCARNDVDSEELAARLEAGGFRLVDDADDAETVVVNTCGFVEAAKKDSVDALLEAAELKGSGTTQAVVAVGCLAERYGKELAESLPEADAVLGFDDYPDIADRLRGILAGEAHPAHVPQRPAAAAADLLPVERAQGTNGRRRRFPATPSRPPTCPAGLAPASGPRAVRRRLGGGSDGAAQAGVGLRPALLVLRDPELPRLVRVAAAQPTCSTRRAGWPARASASCSWSARTPRRTARTSVTSGCWRRCCPSWPPSTGSTGCASPTSSPPRRGPVLVEAIASTPGVASYFDLSFQHASRAGAAADAALRRRRPVPRAARPDPLPRAAGRRAEQRDRRLPRRDRGRPGDAVRRSCRPPASTRSASSATPTRTAPRRSASTATTTRTRSGPASTRSAGSSTSSPSSAPRTGSARRSRCSLETVDGDDRRGPARLPGTRGRRHDHASTSLPDVVAVGDIVTAVVTATSGVDLVADARTQ